MDDINVVWFRYALMAIFVLTLSFGAYFFLSAGGSQPMTLWQFYPSGISFGGWILTEIFLKYAISTWLCVTLLGVSLILFYLGFTEANPERKSNYLVFAGTVFGFATGIPIGRFSSTSRKSR